MISKRRPVTEATAYEPSSLPSAQRDETDPGVSVIGQQDTFEGTIKTLNGVRVLGTLRGKIEAQRSVRVEEGATVEADITAEEVVIAGSFTGYLVGRSRVEITAGGRVSGTLETKRLQLQEGGFIDGELHMQRPDELSVHHSTDGETKAVSAKSETEPRAGSEAVDGANLHSVVRSQGPAVKR